jgi:hypothetical protein
MSYPLWCCYCEKRHEGEQTWDSQLGDYVCFDCIEILEEQRKEK